MDKVAEFNAYRVKMNEKLMASDHKVLKHFFNLYTNAYQEGCLTIKDHC